MHDACHGAPRRDTADPDPARDRPAPARRPSSDRSDPLDDRTRRSRTEPMAVRPLGGGTYAVDAGGEYTVDLPGGRCTCPDHRYRGTWCKHLRRVAREVAVGRVPRPGLAPVDCAVCGRETLVEEPVAPPHRCARCDLAPGDAVVDRETGDRLVVVGAPTGRADETPVPGTDHTVADYPGNGGYPTDDPVVAVLYPVDVPPGGNLPARARRTYRFPLSRVRRVDEETE